MRSLETGLPNAFRRVHAVSLQVLHSTHYQELKTLESKKLSAIYPSSSMNENPSPNVAANDPGAETFSDAVMPLKSRESMTVFILKLTIL